MDLTAEISLYPLQKEYTDIIIQFIKRLRTYPDLFIKVTASSTRVVGPYARVMEAISTEMESVFREEGTQVLVAKFINVSLKDDPTDL